MMGGPRCLDLQTHGLPTRKAFRGSVAINGEATDSTIATHSFGRFGCQSGNKILFFEYTLKKYIYIECRFKFLSVMAGIVYQENAVIAMGLGVQSAWGCGIQRVYNLPHDVVEDAKQTNMSERLKGLMQKTIDDFMDEDMKKKVYKDYGHRWIHKNRESPNSYVLCYKNIDRSSRKPTLYIHDSKEFKFEDIRKECKKNGEKAYEINEGGCSRSDYGE